MSAPPANAEPRIQAMRFGLVLVLLMALPLGLAMVFGPPTAGLLWDSANYIGFVAFGLLVLLFCYRGQPRAFPPFSGRFFSNLHRDLGYLALFFLVLHVVLLLYDQPLLVEHLKPTAPLYMLSGLLAAVLCLLLVVSSVTRLRRRAWPDYRVFRRVHGYLSLVMFALVLVHLWGSGFYLNHRLKLALLVYASVLLLLGYLLRRRGAVGSASPIRLRDSAGFSHRVSLGSVGVMLVLLSWLLWARYAS